MASRPSRSASAGGSDATLQEEQTPDLSEGRMLAIVAKSEVDAWLAQFGSRE